MITFKQFLSEGAPIKQTKISGINGTIEHVTPRQKRTGVVQ